MSHSDLVNATFEMLGGAAIAFSVRKLYKDKRVKGLSLVQVAFFTLWGAWNMLYYPSLGQPLSTLGAYLTFGMNLVFCGQLCYYFLWHRGTEVISTEDDLGVGSGGRIIIDGVRYRVTQRLSSKQFRIEAE